MGIDDRKQLVLQAIVRLYSKAGEPVGSTLLARHFSIPVSSATLRNEMAALTKLGLLEQPHTSAGRVPSTKGYRYYIDNLLDAGALLSEADQHTISTAFREMDFDPERLAEGAARALAQLSGYAVVATTPKSDDMCAAHYEVVQVGRYTAAVLAVTNAGGVRTRTAKLEVALQPEDPARLAAVLNRFLTFRNAADVDDRLLELAGESLGAQGHALLPVVSAAYKLLCEGGRPSVYLEGQQNLLRYRELEGSFRNLMALLGDEDALRSYINQDTPHTVILLGDDLPDYPMPGYCIMSKQYVAGGGRTGAIVIVGPARMPFRELVPRLEYFAQLLGEGMSGKKEEDIST
ncbi:MAG: heat-inducible transcriptional repressor HrcA [Ruthenibacterium sp.]